MTDFNKLADALEAMQAPMEHCRPHGLKYDLPPRLIIGPGCDAGGKA